jgi:UDP-glucose 4-epimerase
VLSIDSLLNSPASSQYNLGNENGYSVKQVIDSVSEITQIEVPIVVGERRLGDPARLVANSQKAKDVLGWSPTRQDLKIIIHDAWLWEKNQL